MLLPVALTRAITSARQRPERCQDPTRGFGGRDDGGVDLDVIGRPAVDDIELRLGLADRPVLAASLALEDDVERTADSDEEHVEARPEAAHLGHPSGLEDDVVDDDIQPRAG